MIEIFYYSFSSDDQNPIFIFDRDDTLVKDIHSLNNADDIEWLPDRLDNLKKLSDLNIHIAIVTNQAKIGRGEISLFDYFNLTNYLTEQLRSIGVNLWAIITCPHSPEANCDCRKPKPGMLNSILNRIPMTNNKIVFLGDKLTDVQSATNASRTIDAEMISKDAINFTQVISKWIEKFL